MSLPPITSATRPVSPELNATLQKLQAGQRIRVTQVVRIGSTGTWTATAVGAFRDLNYLATGLSTHRLAQDDIVVPTVHFTKDNGELSSITLDEHTKVELL